MSKDFLRSKMNPLRNWRFFVWGIFICWIFIPLTSLNISQDGELVMPAMATPDEFSIECDRSDTDHVCLGKIRDNFAFSENF